LHQIERFASATRTAVGFLFLDEPPQEKLPISDFRTVHDNRTQRPSADLLDTIYLCQQKQEWYRTHLPHGDHARRAFVGSAALNDSVVEVAASMRHLLGFELHHRGTIRGWGEALRRLTDLAGSIGVLVTVSGIVGSNTRRILDPEEFRGFSLADDLAPLVFINGADSKASHVFTLAHELAHVWLGESGVDDLEPGCGSTDAREPWCDRVAAELLAPLDSIQETFVADAPLQDEIVRLSRLLNVSNRVVIRRLHHAGLLDQDQFWDTWRSENTRLQARESKKAAGGISRKTQPAQVGRSFAEAVIVSAAEGATPYAEACRLLGLARVSTMLNLGKELGVL
jgi:Zn-dependent peptidase ImmA (M78 family)